MNTNGSYHCYCPEGFHNSLGNCADTDECASSLNHCPDSSTCNNTIGSYQCLCKGGYVQVDETTSEDIDICDSGYNNCMDNMICENTAGSYRCDCKTGYTANVEDNIFACKDINECVTSSHGCEGNCNNTEGSYLCTSADDLLLKGDGVSCRGKILICHFLL